MKKVIAASVVALAVSGSAQAQDMFAFMGGPQDDGARTIIIDPLTASGDGFIAIYDHHTGKPGALLGVAAVREGANRETRVVLGRPVQRDIIAYLFVGNDFTDPSKAVDSVEIDIE